MKSKYESGQQVYFLICGHLVTKATVVSTSSWFVTIRFRKHSDECIIRLPYNRIFATEEAAQRHIRPDLPPMQQPSHNENGEFVCTRRWELWE